MTAVLFFLALRALHVLVAGLWIGSTVFMTFLLEPAVDGAGASGGHVMLPPNGVAVQGRQAIQKWMGEFPPISEFKLEAVDVDGRGDVAYARGNYSMTLSPPGIAPIRDHGKWVEVWRKQADGSWKMRWDIFNSDVPAGPGQ